MTARIESAQEEEVPSSETAGAHEGPAGHRSTRRICYFGDVRVLTFRYLRRFGVRLEPVDSLRLAQKLQHRLPRQLGGPGGRAVIQHIVIEMAGRNNIPIKW